jgi:hypothetical protein
MNSIKDNLKKEVKPIIEKIHYECIRCGFKSDTSSRMQVHINRKIPCKVSDTGLNVNILKYKEQILNHTFENMLRCIFCNEYFADKDLFINHKLICDKEILKKIPMDDTGKNYCERCHKTFKFKDSEHTIVCNDTLDEYKKIEEERDNLEEEMKDLRMLNRKLNEELFKFAGIVHKCIDDYKRSNEINLVEEEEEEET